MDGADRTHPLPALIRHVLRPARGGAIVLIGVFAVLFSLAAKAGFLGIWLGFILGSWFFKYAFVLFDHVARGTDEPPTLDISMVNPVDEQRPLAELLICIGMGAAVFLTDARVGRTPALALALLFLLVIPAVTAVLGLEGNVLKAIYPVVLGRLIAGLGGWYLAVLGVAIGTALLAWGAGALGVGSVLSSGLLMFAVLSFFSALGGAVYERRHELGIDALHSPERTAERQRNIDVRESDQAIAEAYGQVRAGAHVKAWQLLTAWLAGRGHAPEDYRWLCERAAAWPDPRYANRLTQEYVERLLPLRQTGAALDAVLRRLRADPTFRPKSAAATLRIAELAARGGGAPAAARTLLSDFGARFAADPLVASAAALAREIAVSAGA